MQRYLCGFLIAVVLTGCSKQSSENAANTGEEGTISGPFPKTVRGTIGYSYPLEDGSGRILLSLLEYDNAAIIVSSETYDVKGMEEDDVEVTLTIELISSEECDADQCFKGY